MNVDLQAMMDGMSARWMHERAETQMTLGKLIATLKEMAPDAQVVNLCEPHSYRGYYSDFALERHEGTRPASELLADCLNAMGRAFEGYKGGDFVMGELTPVWIACYGCCGQKLIAFNGSEIETRKDE